MLATLEFVMTSPLDAVDWLIRSEHRVAVFDADGFVSE
jgi:hypothetical protein